MKRKSKILLAIFILVLLIAVYQLWINEKAYELNKKGKATVGYVYNYSLRPKSGRSLNVDFFYFVDGVKIEKETIVDGITFRDFGDKFNGRYFPVLFDSTDADHAELLITPKDFKKFRMEFPDSLQWVNEYWRAGL